MDLRKLQLRRLQTEIRYQSSSVMDGLQVCYAVQTSGAIPMLVLGAGYPFSPSRSMVGSGSSCDEENFF